MARTGSIITSAVRKIRSEEKPSLSPMVSRWAAAAWSIWRPPGRGHLLDPARLGPGRATPAVRTAIGPRPGRGPAAGAGRDQARVATEPTRAKLNTAATRCDKADFFDKSIPYSTTRSFLVPEARLPSAFGLTETLGRFRSAKAADAFVSTIRGRMNGCEDKDMAASVASRLQRSTTAEDLDIWSVTTEISDAKKVTYLMAVGRRNDVVVQLGFVPVPGHTIGDAAFKALAERSLDRISNLPADK